MIKKIKFFIEVNRQQIRSLEELHEHFHLQDVLALYRSGVLSRWLEAHGFAEQQKKLAAVPAQLDDRESAEKLIPLFCPDFPKKSLDEALCYLDFSKEQAKKLHDLEKLKMGRDAVIKEYHAGYEQLCSEIVDNFDDLIYITQAARSLARQYWNLVELEMDLFCDYMIDRAPCIFFPLLALGKLRDDSSTSLRKKLEKHVSVCISQLKDQDILYPFLHGKKSKEKDEYKYKFGSLSILRKLTQESWDDIVPDTSKKIMVIYVHSGNYIRCRKERQDLDSAHVNNNFPVLNGLDYKGLGQMAQPLIYLDVTGLA